MFKARPYYSFASHAPTMTVNGVYLNMDGFSDCNKGRMVLVHPWNMEDRCSRAALWDRFPQWQRQVLSCFSMVSLRRSNAVRCHVLPYSVQALSFDSDDATKLTALVQTSQNSDDVDDFDAAGAPAATVYKSHSGSKVVNFGGLASEGRVAACRSTPVRGDSLPQVPDALKIFGS